MAKFLPVKVVGGTVALGCCDRCNKKFPLKELRPDGNSPGLLVCSADWDELDRWRLPARKTEKISVDNPRPDVKLEI